MKCTIPEISWHNRDPVLSVDVQPKCGNEIFERLATGGTDSHVLIWHFEVLDTGAVKVEFAADLQRHQKAVNVVRFSPSGEFLASGDDESAIIIWKQKTDQDAPELPVGDNDVATKEQWLGMRVLRGHVEDVYDLSWSPDSNNLISGSVDNSAIIWDVHKGRNLSIFKDHKGFVQGVTWDPNNKFVATLSSDRTCRVYNINSKRLVSRISKAQLPVPETSDLHGKTVRLFHDDTLKSFFRRLSFTPDGSLLIVPSGIIENSNSDKNANATHIFTRHMFNKPSVYLPSNNQYTVAVRCCPLLFELREREPMFALPYRMVLAVATQNSVLLYDTQQSEPFGIISNIHYTRLTDITWSSSGRMLVVSSTDGYCSIVTFAEGELGVIYEPKKNTTDEECEMSKTKNKSPEKVCEEKENQADSQLDKNKSEIILNELTSDDNNTKLLETQVPSKTNVESSCGQSENEEKKIEVANSNNNSSNVNISPIPVQAKTPRRIKPILLSDPYRKVKKEKNSPDGKSLVSLITTSKKNQTPECDEKSLEVKKRETPLDELKEMKEGVDSITVEDKDVINNESAPERSNKESTDSVLSKSGESCKGEDKDSHVELMEIENEVNMPKGIADVSISKEKIDGKVGTSKEKIVSDSPPVSPLPHCITPGGDKRTPRRVQLITLSSPKSKKKLL